MLFWLGCFGRAVQAGGSPRPLQCVSFAHTAEATPPSRAPKDNAAASLPAREVFRRYWAGPTTRPAAEKHPTAWRIMPAHCRPNPGSETKDARQASAAWWPERGVAAVPRRGGRTPVLSSAGEAVRNMQIKGKHLAALARGQARRGLKQRGRLERRAVGSPPTVGPEERAAWSSGRGRAGPGRMARVRRGYLRSKLRQQSTSSSG